MTRMFVMTFLGNNRWTDDVHPHESPATMTVPMIVLAFGSVLGGLALLFVGNIEEWLEPVIGFEEPHSAIPTPVLIALTLSVVVVGAVVGWRQYAMREVPRMAPTRCPGPPRPPGPTCTATPSTRRCSCGPAST